MWLSAHTGISIGAIVAGLLLVLIYYYKPSYE